LDYYDNAEKWYDSAKFSITGEFYQQSVSQSCLAVELFLKSKLVLIDPNSELDKSHDTINILKEILKKYPTEKDLMPAARNCRKYFNESRYPNNGTDIYTKELAYEFIKYVENIKDYIDTDCQATLDDLLNKYGKDPSINTGPYNPPD